MILKKEKKLREKAERQNMTADLDYREKVTRIKVPDIPQLKPKSDHNFGFFDKFYGPERQMSELYNQSKLEEAKDLLDR